MSSPRTRRPSAAIGDGSTPCAIQPRCCWQSAARSRNRSRPRTGNVSVPPAHAGSARSSNRARRPARDGTRSPRRTVPVRIRMGPCLRRRGSSRPGNAGTSRGAAAGRRPSACSIPPACGPAPRRPDKGASTGARPVFSDRASRSDNRWSHSWPLAKIVLPILRRYGCALRSADILRSSRWENRSIGGGHFAN